MIMIIVRLYDRAEVRVSMTKVESSRR